jgi:hypothetical protein
MNHAKHVILILKKKFTYILNIKALDQILTIVYHVLEILPNISMIVQKHVFQNVKENSIQMKIFALQ